MRVKLIVYRPSSCGNGDHRIHFSIAPNIEFPNCSSSHALPYGSE